MTIRNRLSLQFTMISATLLLLVLLGIYLLAAQYVKTDFHDRLVDRAITNAELFLAQDNLSEEKFRDVQKKFPQSLPEEIIKIYNDKDEPVFIKNSSYNWSRGVIDLVREKKIISYASGSRQTVGIYYIDNSGNFAVLASAQDTYGQEQMRQLFWVMVIAFLISVCIMFITGRIFARLALLPMIKVMNDVKFIRSTSLDKRLKTKSGKDEINELAITFNNLLEHLEQSFEAQKSFIAHASHELRTPVTSIIGDIEVTLNQSRTKEEYKSTLVQVLEESENLKELINNLFELAQTNIDITDFQEIRLDELLWQVKDEWVNKISESNVDLDYYSADDPKKFMIMGNSNLLFIALGNLLKNAIKFSNNRIVTCKLYSQNNAPVISIRDKGIGISKEDLQNIFQPFYRGGNTFGYAGYGIGLSLTDKILRLHNARIDVHSVLGQGTEFLIHFQGSNRV